MATLPVSALSGLDLPAVGSWVLTFVGVNLAAALAAASWPGGSPFKDTIGRLQCAQRAASTIHSSLGVATWLRVVLSDWGSLTDAEGHFVPLAVMGDQVSLELGYYLVDTAVDAVKWSLEGRVNWGDAVHHAMCIGGFWAYSLARPLLSVGDFLTGVLLAMHASTPLLNLSWFLLKTGRGGTPLAAAVQGLFAAVFFVVRVLSWPFAFWLYSRVSGVPAWELPRALPSKCVAGSAVLMGLNLYWFIGGLRKLKKRGGGAARPRGSKDE